MYGLRSTDVDVLNMTHRRFNLRMIFPQLNTNKAKTATQQDGRQKNGLGQGVSF